LHILPQFSSSTKDKPHYLNCITAGNGVTISLVVFQEIMQRRLTRMRQGHVVKQVAAGREFRGRPFRATPEIVVFKVC